MHDRIERLDGPDEGGPRRPELARDDLWQRLGRLADGHPSSDRYRTADSDQPDAGRDASRADPMGKDATGELTSREERAGARRDDSWAATERASSAWDFQAGGHQDRPAEGDIGVSADRERHILDGEPDSAGGGHRHGTGRPGKTEFPEQWPDNQIMSVIEDVSRNPDYVEWQPNGRWRVGGDHDGVRVNAIVLPDGRIWTAWPEPGGKGVVQHPEAS